MPFFTEIDPNAAIKGSRDPLGYQPVWAAFGRKVVGNLTTVTTSVRNFTTLMLGLYFADRAIAAGKCSEADRVAAFLKFEQLAAYSRYAYSDTAETSQSPLGLRRIRQRLGGNKREAVKISAKQEHQILSSQKAYGLWGAFMVASRQSGLVEQRENRLTQYAVEFIENNYPLSSQGNRYGHQIIKYLEGDEMNFAPKGKNENQESLGKELASVLGSRFTAGERAFYNQALVYGQAQGCDHTAGLQARLWQTIVQVNNNGKAAWTSPFTCGELIATRDAAQSHSDHSLSKALDDISVIEPVLAASAKLFGFILLQGNATVDDVAKDVRNQWGSKGLWQLRTDALEALRERIATAASKVVSDKINQIAQQLYAGHYATAIHTLIELNTEVMKQRSGAPWVTISNGKLEVQLREESGGLPARDELPFLLQNTYFINSLKWVGKTLNCP